MPVSPGNEQIPSSPVLVDGTLVVLMSRLFGVDAQTGEVLWSVDSKASNSTPVIAGNRLLTFGHSRSGGLRCFDLGSSPPEELWAFRGAADSGSSPVVVDGSVYVQGESRLACVDLESGKASWQTSLDLAKPRYTSLVAADGKVFYAFDGVLYFEATPEKFRPLISGLVISSPKKNRRGRSAGGCDACGVNRRFFCSCSGGVAPLNHRLMAVIPWDTEPSTLIYTEELIPACLAAWVTHALSRFSIRLSPKLTHSNS